MEPAIVLDGGYIDSPWRGNQDEVKPSPGVPKGRSGSGNGHPSPTGPDHLINSDARPPSQYVTLAARVGLDTFSSPSSGRCCL